MIGVGLVMLMYVLFGGMMATTWVQIIKAVLLLSGATLLAGLVLARFAFNPFALFHEATTLYGASVLSPGRLVTNPIDAVSLGLALMLGTAGLPHILMRFYTVADARTARSSVGYATAFIGFFYLLTFVLGFGAMVIIGREPITAIDAGGNMAAPLLAESVGVRRSSGSLRLWRLRPSWPSWLDWRSRARRRCRTISGTMWCGMDTRASASSWSSRGWRACSSRSWPSSLALRSRDRTWPTWWDWRLRLRRAPTSRLLLAIFWKRLTTAGAQASLIVGTVSARAHLALAHDPGRHAQGRGDLPVAQSWHLEGDSSARAAERRRSAHQRVRRRRRDRGPVGTPGPDTSSDGGTARSTSVSARTRPSTSPASSGRTASRRPSSAAASTMRSWRSSG